MHDLSINCMNVKMGTHISNTIGVVKACDVKKDGSSWETSLHVLIEMDLKKPISRGRSINVLGNKFWISLRYEKLPCICFGCGRKLHGEELCEGGKTLPKSLSGQYGLWLREVTGSKMAGRKTSCGFLASNSSDK